MASQSNSAGASIGDGKPEFAHFRIRASKSGDMNIGVQTSHSERVSPIISAVLIAGGIVLAIAGTRTRPSKN